MTVQIRMKTLTNNLWHHVAKVNMRSEQNPLIFEFKRWSTGKEGNLRASSQPCNMYKAYRKATLHVHPDKLQQQGASIREKYICEKVFDLLKFYALPAIWRDFVFFWL
ncbi:hypothetical protein DCAR_0311347 [Daucus carota subsp. sativus]|uniref:J domain-containing protein n=1 Tax=Daucus carota subsp. sativus TaxID=79200 RepID=A0AAF0WM09_DAUCS|nr:hypothetical protein DCAR_0311347 [Daucus carota subsp. sativus]